MKDINNDAETINIDKYGVIGQLEPGETIDGGDSLNWCGHLIYLSDEFLSPEMYFHFFHDKGKHLGFVRHPLNKKTHAFYKNPWYANGSKDQITGPLSIIIKYKCYKEAFKFIIHHACWLFLFAYNTVRNNDDTYKWKWPDPTLADIWAMEIRALGPVAWLLWPLLNILDIQMLLATILFNIKPMKDPISFALKSLVQKEHCPTLVSLLSWKLLNKVKLMVKINDYWSWFRSNPGMVPLYRDKFL